MKIVKFILKSKYKSIENMIFLYGKLKYFIIGDEVNYDLWAI